MNKTEWKEKRLSILVRDKFTCRKCKKRLSENKPDVILRVHHIRPRKYGGTDEDSNLITLCRRCEKRIHNLSKDKRKLKKIGGTNFIDIPKKKKEAKAEKKEKIQKDSEEKNKSKKQLRIEKLKQRALNKIKEIEEKRKIDSFKKEEAPKVYVPKVEEKKIEKELEEKKKEECRIIAEEEKLEIKTKVQKEEDNPQLKVVKENIEEPVQEYEKIPKKDTKKKNFIIQWVVKIFKKEW